MEPTTNLKLNPQDKYDWTNDELQTQLIHWGSLSDYMEQLSVIEKEQAALYNKKAQIHKVIAEQFRLLTRMYKRLAERQTE